ADCDAWETAYIAGRDPGPVPVYPGTSGSDEHFRETLISGACIRARMCGNIGPLDYLAGMSKAAEADCDRLCGSVWAAHNLWGPESAQSGNSFSWPEWQVFNDQA